MRLASLFSGGKDSVFALYLAQQMGHEIACLVTVEPSDGASWMFHTPNLDAVPLMAEAVGAPLVSVPSDGTEAGDLEALRSALSGLDVDGVVAGAVWSDYQWDRIGSVCADLGLVALCPLWRKSQDMVYREMVDAGVDAVIVAVAAEGLDGGWLGLHLDMGLKPRLDAVRDRFGVSVIGEGGEYESMALDSPSFSSRIEIREAERVCGRSSGVLRVGSARLVGKPAPARRRRR